MNMIVLKRSRKKPRVGDIFVLKIVGFPFHFGRVIRTDAKAGDFDNMNLIYIYNAGSSNFTLLPSLSKNDLLIPPLMTNDRPWTMGYFQTINHQELTTRDVLKLHVFRDSRGWFFDDKNNRLKGNYRHYGGWGLTGYYGIDHYVSKALGLISDNASVS